MLSLLQYLFDSGIIDMENKNAAAHRWANTREPARVQYHLHSGHLAAPLLYYTTSRPLSQGGFCRFIRFPPQPPPGASALRGRQTGGKQKRWRERFVFLLQYRFDSGIIDMENMDKPPFHSEGIISEIIARIRVIVNGRGIIYDKDIRQG